MENQAILNQYNEEEIKQLLNSDEKLVYIDNGSEEFVARYEDLPDIIVDINDKIGSTNLTVMEFDNPSKILLTTFGPFLNKCDPDVRKDIIDRLNNLQQGIEEIKDYKVIDEDMLDDIIEYLKEANYINDYEFIEKQVNEYMLLKTMSIKEIRYKLYGKGLDKKLIEKYIETHKK